MMYPHGVPFGFMLLEDGFDTSYSPDKPFYKLMDRYAFEQGVPVWFAFVEFKTDPPTVAGVFKVIVDGLHASIALHNEDMSVAELIHVDLSYEDLSNAALYTLRRVEQTNQWNAHVAAAKAKVEAERQKVDDLVARVTELERQIAELKGGAS